MKHSKIRLRSIIVFCLLLSSTGFSQNKRNFLAHVQGIVKIIHVYKGGAAPSEEMLTKLSQPMPMANEKLFLKKSFYSSKSFVLQTDSTGYFELDIKPGVYNIYLSDEIASSKLPYAKEDSLAKCREQYKSQSHGTMRVFKKGNSPLEITIHETINPCDPQPPATTPRQN